MKKIKNFKNGLLYCIFTPFTLSALVLLIVFSSIKGNAYTIISFTIYGCTLFLFSLFQTLYYWLNLSPKKAIVFKKFSLISTTLLIQGSLLPICLCTLRNPLGWTFFGISIAFSIFEIITYSIWSNISSKLYFIFFSILPISFLFLNPFIINNFNYLNLLLFFSIIFIFLGFINYLKNIKNSNLLKPNNFYIYNLFFILSIIFYFFYTLFYTIKF